MNSQEFEELPLLLNVHEAAKLLRVGHTAVREAIRCGQLPGITIGRRVRVPKESLRPQLFPQSKQAA